jgi:hypothetical protein
MLALAEEVEDAPARGLREYLEDGRHQAPNIASALYVCQGMLGSVARALAIPAVPF